jgi:thiol-disulfide isomerase/thioredoxin
MKFFIFSGMVFLLSVSVSLWAGGSNETVPSTDAQRVADSSDTDEQSGPTPPENITAEQKTMWELGFQIPKETFPAQDFTLKNQNNEEVSLSSFKGQIVFLNFWATWCPPCKKEMPSMQALHETLEDEEFMMLAVNLQEDPQKVKDFLDKNGYTFPVLMDTQGKVGGRLYEVKSIPTTYILDKNNNILARVVGTREWNTDEIQQLFRELAKE